MRKFLMPTLGLIAAVVVSGSVALGADKASQKFITEAIQGNLAEIAVGKLAQEKGQSAIVWITARERPHHGE